MKKEQKRPIQLPPWELKKLADQMKAALKDYRERLTKDPKAEKPEYLIVGEIDLYVDGFLVICKDLEAMAKDKEKEFGPRAPEALRILADKLQDEVMGGLAQAFSRVCLPAMESYPEPKAPEVEETEEPETEEGEEHE